MAVRVEVMRAALRAAAAGRLQRDWHAPRDMYWRDGDDQYAQAGRDVGEGLCATNPSSPRLDTRCATMLPQTTIVAWYGEADVEGDTCGGRPTRMWQYGSSQLRTVRSFFSSASSGEIGWDLMSVPEPRSASPRKSVRSPATVRVSSTMVVGRTTTVVSVPKGEKGGYDGGGGEGKGGEGGGKGGGEGGGHGGGSGGGEGGGGDGGGGEGPWR